MQLVPALLKSARPFRERDIVSMSANDSALENWLARSLERARKADTPGKQPAQSISEPKLNDTDRMVALIEAAAAKFDSNDPGKVETLFAAQTLALDVIFKEFIRRRTYTFDNMRVALKAQAQCRITFKSLTDFNNPRRPARRGFREIRASRLLKPRKSPDDQTLA